LRTSAITVSIGDFLQVLAGLDICQAKHEHRGIVSASSKWYVADHGPVKRLVQLVQQPFGQRDWRGSRTTMAAAPAKGHPAYIGNRANCRVSG